MKNTKSTGKERLMMGLVEWVFEPRIEFTDERIQGQELKEPCVIICNHTCRVRGKRLSVADGPILRYAFNNERVCSLMAKDLMELPVLRRIISDCDCIPVNRKSPSTDWLHLCLAQLKAGKSVIIFPEGTTMKQRDIEEFKNGFLLLAKLANVPVLPVAVNGVYKPFHRGELVVKIGTPQKLRLNANGRAAMDAEARRFQNIVADMFYDLHDGECSSYEPLERTV